MESLIADGEHGSEEPCFGPLTVDELLDAVWGLARRLTRSPEDAENLLQDVYEKLLAPDVQWPDSKAAAARYAQVTMARTNIDTHRREVEARPHNAVVDDTDRRERVVQGGVSVEDRAIATADLRGEILVAVSRLSPSLREVVLLALELEEGSLAAMSHSDLRAALDLPAGTLRRRLHDAKEQLREALAHLRDADESGGDR